jgi:hypothetical protein
MTPEVPNLRLCDVDVQPKKFRLHFEERNGTLRVVAQAIFGGDGSLYLVPYAAGGDYWYGQQTLPAGQTEFEVRFREQIAAAARPKLSLHWSGDVHIYASDSPKAGPIEVIPLSETRGEHVASVQVDHVKLLQVYGRTPRVGVETTDVAFGVPPDIEAGRILVYANGRENRFQVSHVHVARSVSRPDGKTVWFGFTAAANEALGDGSEGGVTVLAGFDARKGENEDQDFLFLRGV